MSLLRLKTPLLPAAAALLSAATALLAGTASADPPPAADPASPPPAASSAAPSWVVSTGPTFGESPAPAPDSTAAIFEGVERPWLYSPDATAPPPGHVLVTMGVGYAQIDRGAARPFAGNIAQAGAVFGAGAEVGIFRFASVHAEGLLAGDGAGTVNAGAMAGVTFYPLPAKSPVDVAVSAGYLRELGGGNGVWGRVTVAGDLGPVRLSLAALGEHVFEEDRDAVDLLVSTGASWKVAQLFRLGFEYVVQDLEGAFFEEEEEEADGGIRHFLSPTATFELYRRVRLSAGPAFGLSPGSPSVLGRLQAGYSF